MFSTVELISAAIRAKCGHAIVGHVELHTFCRQQRLILLDETKPPVQ